MQSYVRNELRQLERTNRIRYIFFWVFLWALRNWTNNYETDIFNELRQNTAGYETAEAFRHTHFMSQLKILNDREVKLIILGNDFNKIWLTRRSIYRISYKSFFRHSIHIPGQQYFICYYYYYYYYYYSVHDW